MSDVPPTASPSFFQELRRAVYSSPLEAVGVIAAGFGFVIGAGGLIAIFLQLSATSRQLADEAYAHLYDKIIAIDQTFISYPELKPWFDGGKVVTPGEPIPDRVRAMAELKLDVIDYFFSQRTNLSTANYQLSSWTSYFQDSFRNSPAMCAVMKDEQAEYGNSLQHLASGICRGVRDPRGKSE